MKWKVDLYVGGKVFPEYCYAVNRQDAIEKLINDAETKIKEMGYKHIFSIGRTQKLINTHKKLGWFVDKQPSYEIIKNI